MGNGASALGNNGKQDSTLGNGVAVLIGINLVFYVLDGILGLGFMRSLYLPLDGASWYTYVTSLFCHAGWMHLSGNLVFLYLFGKLVEEQEGTLGVVVAYLVCGIGGNVVSELFLSGGYGLGASGAVFGLFVVAFLIKIKRSVRNLIEALILGQFVVAQVITEARSVTASDGIGHLAHLGGALTGAVLIFAVTKVMHKPGARDAAAKATSPKAPLKAKA